MGGIILLLEFNVCGLLYYQQEVLSYQDLQLCFTLPGTSAGIHTVLIYVHKARCG